MELILTRLLVKRAVLDDVFFDYYVINRDDYTGFEEAMCRDAIFCVSTKTL